MSQLTKLLKVEQTKLWGDLFWELRMANNGQWSVGAENKIKRILLIAHEVGVTPWGHVQTPLLTSGVYNSIRLKLQMPIEAFNFPETHDVSFPPGWVASCVKIKNLDLQEILNDFKEEEVS